MSLATAKVKIKRAFERDPEIVTTREKAGETFGSNPDYLLDIFGIMKSDLQRLERYGMAIKARYETKTGEHRVRWLIFKEALE